MMRIEEPDDNREHEPDERSEQPVDDISAADDSPEPVGEQLDDGNHGDIDDDVAEPLSPGGDNEPDETGKAEADGGDESRGESKRAEKPRKKLSEKERESIMKVIEAVLFAGQEPLSAPRIAACIPGMDGRTVRSMLFDLRNRYDEQELGFELEEVAGGFRLYTRPEYYPYIERLFKQRSGVKLSPAAIETLAIIAYKQPVTRAQIEDVRGVAAGPLLRTLLDFDLIKIVGRKEILGRPLLYGTTKKFLENFGLKGIKDLPRIEEFQATAKDKGLTELQAADVQSVALETASETADISPDGTELMGEGEEE